MSFSGGLTDESDLAIQKSRYPRLVIASVHVPMSIVEQEMWEPRANTGPLPKHMPTELVPDKKAILYHLLESQPATWGVVQILSGILSFGPGVVFAIAFNTNDVMVTLCRVFILTGILFFISGCLSNLLHRHPGLLTICFHSNVCCLCMATIGAVLLYGDLKGNKSLQDLERQVEFLGLCKTLLDMLISCLLLYFIFNAQKYRHDSLKF